MIKTINEQGFISVVYEGKTHEDHDTYLFACFLSQEGPKNLIQALKDPSWIEAMQEELLQFKNKKDERGIVIRNKARLVAQGHTQEEGIDYDKVFAPVSRIEAIRLFLAYASYKDFMVYQMDDGLPLRKECSIYRQENPMFLGGGPGGKVDHGLGEYSFGGACEKSATVLLTVCKLALLQKFIGEPSTNPTSTIPNHRNCRHSKQRVEPFSLEENPVVTMADQRTMAELLQAPTVGYGDAIVAFPLFREEILELKNGLKLHQLDTFYNALTLTYQDSLNAVADGNLLTKTPRDALTIIENKLKVRNSRNKPIVTKVSTNTPSFSTLHSHEIASLVDAVKAMLHQKSSPPTSMKAVEEICVTYGSRHPYHQCDKMPKATTTDISLTKSYIPKVSKIPGISPTIAQFYKPIENRNIHEGCVVDQAYYKSNNIERLFTNIRFNCLFQINEPIVPRFILDFYSQVTGYVGNKSVVFPPQLLGYLTFKGQVLNGKQLWELIEGLEGCIGTVCFLDTVLEVVSKLRSAIAALTYGECINSYDKTN
ncbi:reverse transcriptase domain-containing protein [Tanacetum coccineum]